MDTEAKEIGLERRSGGGKGGGGRKLPLSLNHREGTIKRRMKTERRGK
jgi:hypothetical protein